MSNRPWHVRWFGAEWKRAWRRREKWWRSGAGRRDSDPGARCGAGQEIGSTGPRGAVTLGIAGGSLQRDIECGFFHVGERITPASSQRQKPSPKNHRDPTSHQKQKGGNILFHRDMTG